MKNALLTLIWASAVTVATSQPFQSLRTGNETNMEVEPDFGLCLMGGAGENDGAMIWFLEKANGGDVLVIREGGLGGYNDYMYSELGVSLNSVETISFESEEAATDPYVLQRLSEAEAIWMAGGDQGEYYDLWKDTPVMDAINDLLNVRGGALGGISAGMAIMAEAYFPALVGTVTSEEVLADPLANNVLLGYGDFIDAPYLEGTITETHFNDPDRIRYGRVMGFMARLQYDQSISPKAIASNEYCAVTIDGEGMARAWGEYPEFDDDYVYFLQENPANTMGPEIIEADLPLTWIRNEEAVKVYKVPGTEEGLHEFNLNDWSTGSGGVWQNWWVDEGELFMGAGEPLSIDDSDVASEFLVFPNPAADEVYLSVSRGGPISYSITELTGRTVQAGWTDTVGRIDISQMPSGIYLVRLLNGEAAYRLVVNR
jgi:cyanophycinase-like exopeptidase